MWIEHFDPASQNPDRASDYENCVYVCRFCNLSRASAPGVDAEGRRLLNPGRDAWGQRFVLSEERLLPSEDDPDAIYTCMTYDLNDPRKVQRRELRRNRLKKWLKILREGTAAVQYLEEQAQHTDLPAQTAVLQNAVALLKENISSAAMEIRRYLAVPLDADPFCPCGNTDHHRLPEWLAEQVQILS